MYVETLYKASAYKALLQKFNYCHSFHTTCNCRNMNGYFVEKLDKDISPIYPVEFHFKKANLKLLCRISNAVLQLPFYYVPNEKLSIAVIESLSLGLLLPAKKLQC